MEKVQGLLLSLAFEILGDIVDSNECKYDHHGNCQEHGWTNDSISCPHKRAKEWLVEMGKIMV